MPHTLNAQGRTSWLFAVAILTLGLAAADAHAYYHPTVGRWIQRDPIGYADGMNLYEYVRGRPQDLRDPGGTGPCASTYALDDAPKAILQAVGQTLGRLAVGYHGGPQVLTV